MHEWQAWLVAALLLAVAEMAAPGFWLLSVALGCLAAGLVSVVAPGVLVPTLTFAAGTLLSLVGIRPVLLRSLHARGRVLVEGEDWRGASLLDVPLEAGTRVMVIRVEGNTLYVDRET